MVALADGVVGIRRAVTESRCGAGGFLQIFDNTVTILTDEVALAADALDR